MSGIVEGLRDIIQITDNYINFLEGSDNITGDILSPIATELPKERKTRVANKTRKGNGYFKESFLRIKEVDPGEFFLNTRMTKEIFNNLLTLCKPYLIKLSIREAISPEKRLALTLLYLSQGCNTQSLALSWKLGKETVRMVIYDTCDVLWNVLSTVYVSEPSVREMQVISHDFWTIWDMPNCLGAIDGKHIAIVKPSKSSTEFNYNKKSCSIVLMAACDPKYIFTYADVVAFRSQDEGGIINASAFGKRLLNNTLPMPPPELLPNSDICLPYYFVADTAFPLTTNIMKGYSGVNLPASKNYFNKRISRTLNVIENAFGILFARWRILLTTLHMLPANAEKVVLACVSLHNFLILHTHDEKYIPQNYADWEDENNVMQNGLWRSEVPNNLNSLRPLRHAHIHQRNTSIANRDQLCSFVNNFSYHFNFDIAKTCKLEFQNN